MKKCSAALSLQQARVRDILILSKFSKCRELKHFYMITFAGMQKTCWPAHTAPSTKVKKCSWCCICSISKKHVLYEQWPSTHFVVFYAGRRLHDVFKLTDLWTDAVNLKEIAFYILFQIMYRNWDASRRIFNCWLSFEFEVKKILRNLETPIHTLSDVYNAIFHSVNSCITQSHSDKSHYFKLV